MEFWNAIPSRFQERILHNVWCPHCGDMTTMTEFTGGSTQKEFALTWVSRVLEGAPESEALQRGDRSITVPLLIPPNVLYSAVNVEYSA